MSTRIVTGHSITAVDGVNYNSKHLLHVASDNYFATGSSIIHNYLLRQDTSTNQHFMVVNATSTSPVNFDYTFTGIAAVKSLSMIINDTAMSAGVFGGLSNLTNGVKVELIDTDGSTSVFDFTSYQNIRNNGDIAVHSGNRFDIYNDVGSEADLLHAEFNFSEGNNDIYGATNQVFRITVQDDISGLTNFAAIIKGKYL